MLKWTFGQKDPRNIVDIAWCSKKSTLELSRDLPFLGLKLSYSGAELTGPVRFDTGSLGVESGSLVAVGSWSRWARRGRLSIAI